MDMDQAEQEYVEETSRVLARVMKEELELVPLPVENAMERRVIALKFAIDTKGVAFSLKNDASVEEAASQVIIAAKMYEEYIIGEVVSDAD